MTRVFAEVGGFTPLIDSIVQEVGFMQAGVFGVVWRYCQLKNGICNASMDTIAGKLDISPRTALRHVKALCEVGYLEDTTPNLRNKPHTYKDTGKAKMKLSMQAGVTESHTDDDIGMTESHSAMTESHSKKPVGMTESHSHYDRESHEETLEETNTNNIYIPAKEILDYYVELFPQKPRHRLSTISRKAKTRMKSKAFRENWRKSLDHASKSVICLQSDWFNLTWFLKNDENWEKVLMGTYDWKNKRERDMGGLTIQS